MRCFRNTNICLFPLSVYLENIVLDLVLKRVDAINYIVSYYRITYLTIIQSGKSAEHENCYEKVLQHRQNEAK